MRTMKILLTAFKSFGQIKNNVSEQITKDVVAQWKKNKGELQTLIMPVEWERTEKMLEYQLSTHNPDMVISMGHAENYKHITLEVKYFNRAVGIDNAGRKRKNNIIKISGKQTYSSNINVSKIVTSLNNDKIPAIIHSDAGGMDFLCNFAAYIVAHYVNSKRLTTKHIFVHVPSPNDISYSTLLKGIKRIVQLVATKI